ncbi:hypothetical protein F0L74_10995 [Chitinophaga agrisoli]|uniref:Secreted protein (Por secretion system target) n=1 Tax=Chitinophaga agrisoli TaxID=2607653 RepID=A0A5B2VWQ5_9BACT|nr:hypothetical protein [Chitinophaga agrisoli]KAA2243038.1 hypothetical protein F0L74_10995 [Chitinophaga agrisoli]
MKRGLLFVIILLACSQFVMAQAPNNPYAIRWQVRVPLRTPEIRWTVKIVQVNWDNSEIVLFNQVVKSNSRQFFSGVEYRNSSVHTIRMDVATDNGRNNISYYFPVDGNTAYSYDRTGTYSGDNFNGDYSKILWFSIRVFNTMQITNPERTNPIDDKYCEDGHLRLKVAYNGGSTFSPNGFWQYRLGGVGDFSPLVNAANGIQYQGNLLDVTPQDIFGGNYKNHLYERIEFRAAPSVGYGYDSQYSGINGELRGPIYTLGPDEGSNILAYYFLPALPKPVNVSAVQPRCSYDQATGVTINFDRDLNSIETINALTIFRDLGNGNKDVFDQYADANGNTTITSLPGNTLTWSNVKAMAPGNYLLSVEGKNNGQTACAATFYPFTVTAPTPVTIADIVPQKVLCFNGNGGSITVTPAGGQGNGDVTQYEYSKDDGVTWQSGDNVFRNLTAGNYTIKIRDSYGCTSPSSQPVTITAPTAPLKITVDGFLDPKGYGTNDGFINTSVSNGTPPYTYAWSNGATTEDLTGLGGGEFKLVATDANGCQQEAKVPLVEPDSIAIDLEETPISCNGRQDGALKATAHGGIGVLSYRWSNNKTTTTITGLGKNRYTITVTDENNISKSVPYDLNEPDILTATLLPLAALCNGDANGSITSTVDGGTVPYAYAWNTAGTADHLDNLVAGAYNVTVTDGHGCTTTADTTVTQPEPLTIQADVVLPTRYQLADGRIDITPQGGTTPYVYKWSNGPVTEDINGLGDGTYEVLLTDKNNCTLKQSYIIKQPDPLTGAIEETARVLCNDAATGKLYAHVNGGVRAYRYAWDDGATDSVRTGLKAGDYGVTVTDKSGVQLRLTYTIKQPTALTLSTTGSEISCSGAKDGTVGSVAGGGVTPYSYLWSNGATTPNQQGIIGGTYLLQVTDANGCIIKGSAIVNVPNALTISSQVKDPTCDGYTDGAITLTTTGGRLPYRYTWNTGALTSSINNLPAGYYKITLQDKSGCKLTQEFNLVAPPPLTVSIGADKTLCVDQEYILDATIAEGYTYEWTSNNGFTASTPAVTVTKAGDYWVKVASQPGCIARDTAIIKTDDREINASFLVSTQAYKGESIIVANVSFPRADSVKWNLPKGAVITSEDSSVVELSFPNSGQYTVGMTAYRGDCTAYMAKDLIVIDTVALPGLDTEFESLFKRTVVRPNPNNGQFYVDVEVTVDAPVNYRFVDITRNKTVYEKRSQLSQSTVNTEAFNIPNLPAGVYVLLLETAKERKALKVMIL